VSVSVIDCNACLSAEYPSDSPPWSYGKVKIYKENIKTTVTFTHFQQRNGSTSVSLLNAFFLFGHFLPYDGWSSSAWHCFHGNQINTVKGILQNLSENTKWSSNRINIFSSLQTIPWRMWIFNQVKNKKGKQVSRKTIRKYKMHNMNQIIQSEVRETRNEKICFKVGFEIM